MKLLEPDAAPQNLTAVNKTSNSILIKWGQVPHSKRQGRILKYRVDYAPTANNNDTKSGEVNVTTKYLKIDGLDNDTNYTIAVSASTSKGYGPASAPIFVVTDQSRRKSTCINVCRENV